MGCTGAVLELQLSINGAGDVLKPNRSCTGAGAELKLELELYWSCIEAVLEPALYWSCSWSGTCISAVFVLELELYRSNCTATPGVHITYGAICDVEVESLWSDYHALCSMLYVPCLPTLLKLIS